MNTAKNTAKDLLCLTICIVSLAAIFYFESIIYNYLATCIALITVGVFNREHRELLPILMFVVAAQVVAFLASMVPVEAMLLRLTALSLLDLLLAFFIVHYHKDPALYNFFKVKEPAMRVPQVYLLSLVLAIASLFYFLMAAEVMLYYVDENFFNGGYPFFHSISSPVLLGCAIMFDLAIWSMLLNPNNWKFLRKIDQRFDL
ncbi:MAG: hypothetical protein KKF79_03220 [Gammaproteobacteria bacterium]|nr:hypothetical protein [Gammaproteobacteria bacterium]MBU2224942.1 hypothetical protein [Gammaproteobacteria bacterium]